MVRSGTRLKERVGDDRTSKNRLSNRKSGSALSKALGVVQVIVDSGRPLTVAEMSLRLGVPRQTGHRLVRQFEEMGLVARTLDRDRFVVGEAMIALSRNIMRSSYAWTHVHDILEKLVQKTNESGNVGILDGMAVMYVERVACNWPLRVQLEAGSRVPIHCTAIGKLLLAHLPDGDREKMLRSLSFEKFTEHTIVRADILAAQCEKIRKDSYSLNIEEYLPGIVGLGVPIVDISGHVIAGIALHAPRIRVSVKKIMTFLKPLNTAAQAISSLQAMGKASIRP